MRFETGDETVRRRFMGCGLLVVLMLVGRCDCVRADLLVQYTWSDSFYGGVVNQSSGTQNVFGGGAVIRTSLADGVFLDDSHSYENSTLALDSSIYGHATGLNDSLSGVWPAVAEIGFELDFQSAGAIKSPTSLEPLAVNDILLNIDFDATATQTYDFSLEMSAKSLISDSPANPWKSAGIAGLTLYDWTRNLLLFSASASSINGSPAEMVNVLERITLEAGHSYRISAAVATRTIGSPGAGDTPRGLGSAAGSASARLYLRAVPEPTSLAMLGLGGLATLGRLARRRRVSA